MRILVLGLGLLALTLAMAGCNGGGGGTATTPSLAGGDAGASVLIPGTAELATSTVTTDAGESFDALGLYWLERDANAPTEATLTMARSGAAAQGDIYELSVRPFMTPDSLRLIATATGPGNTTNYVVEFTHPFPMPTDLARPATATKRADLFLFDVQTVLIAPGQDKFFRNSIQTNTSMMPNADGYRLVEPLLNLSKLGITDGTNLFPYKLLYNPTPGLMTGNYTFDNGWLGTDHLNARGYDVIPQGGSAQTTLRVKNGLTGPIGVAVLAKYMDPRDGATIEEKRENRLPDPARPRSFRYFLPEACGDLQILTTSTQNTVREDASQAISTVTTRILDWDHEYPVAANFPDQTQPTAIRVASHPGQIRASFPDLAANEEFSGTVGVTSGEVGEFIDVAVPVRNIDLQLVDIPATGQDVQGLIRVIDNQDLSGNTTITLDEDQQSVEASNLLNARYQLATVHVDPKLQVSAVNLTESLPFQTRQFGATVVNGPATAWHWNFGPAASPSTSPLANPFVTLTDIEGEYECSVTVSHLDAQVVFPFTLKVSAGVPSLPQTQYNYANLPLPRHFTDPEFPMGVIVTSDNTPATNPVTDAGATLGRVLFYDVRLSQNYSTSCASCHVQSTGFATNNRFNQGFAGSTMTRNTMPLANIRYYNSGHMFYDERAGTLEEQALMPITNAAEMGMSMTGVRARLGSTDFYGPLFEDAFGDSEITDERIGLALAQFMRSIVSFRSKFDEGMSAGPGGTPDFPAVFNDQEMLGMALFEGVEGISAPNMQCNQCHDTGTQTLGAAAHATSGQLEGPGKVNNGLGTAYYEPVTTIDEFKSPSLRNVELTGPYMHDGRFTTLDSVVNFYATGVQAHPNLHRFLRINDQEGNQPERFDLSSDQKAALVAFLKTLTDQPLRTDPKYSNPFTGS